MAEHLHVHTPTHPPRLGCVCGLRVCAGAACAPPRSFGERRALSADFVSLLLGPFCADAPEALPTPEGQGSETWALDERFGFSGLFQECSELAG